MQMEVEGLNMDYHEYFSSFFQVVNNVNDDIDKLCRFQLTLWKIDKVHLLKKYKVFMVKDTIIY